MMNCQINILEFHSVIHSGNYKLLSGEDGTNREDYSLCQIRANNDYAAVARWLSSYNNANTRLSYKKESERILLWCIVSRKKALSSLVLEDFELYFNFIIDPQPRELWCAVSRGSNAKKGSEGWKPFIGPLSISAQRTAKTILNSMMDYLVKARYLKNNPIALLRLNPGVDGYNSTNRKSEVMDRILQPDEWRMMQHCLKNFPEKTRHEKDDKERLIFIVSILFLLGIRANELASSSWNQFRQLDDKWWFFLQGKGGKSAMLPVNNSLLAMIKRFRQHCKMPLLPINTENNPIIPSWRSNKGISTNYIAKLLKQLALRTAEEFTNKPSVQKKLAKFSPHWLRHLSASMQDWHGIPFQHIRENLRHSKDDTTRIYMHSFDQTRHDSMQKLVFDIE